MKDQTTLKEFFLKTMEAYGESWEDVVGYTLPEDKMNQVIERVCFHPDDDLNENDLFSVLGSLIYNVFELYVYTSDSVYSLEWDENETNMREYHYSFVKRVPRNPPPSY